MSKKAKQIQAYTLIDRYRMSLAIVVIVLSISAVTACAQEITKAALPETAKQREERMQWWREARFGMFIHWGPVSLKGTEISWSRANSNPACPNRGPIPVEVYDNLYKEFNPVEFDAKEWVAIAQASGMRYIVLTAKHCDGFCLWHSKVTDYNISKTPFGRDVCAELAKAAQTEGIRVGWYYSPMDWRDPDCRTERNAKYVASMQEQLRELLSNYGRIDMLWFDTDGRPAPWDQEKTYGLVKQLQPHIIINNRLDMGSIADYEAQQIGPNADYYTPEQRIGKFDVQRPWETCMTLGTQWSWKSNDDIKSLKECLHILIKCVSGGGNLLLNVGPMPNGKIEPRQVEVLKGIGKWLGQFGESIYGTTASPLGELAWGRCTAKPGKLYLHVFDWPKNGELKVPMPRNDVQKAYLLARQERAELLLDSDDNGNLFVTVPRKVPNVIDTVVVLETEAEAIVIPQSEDGSIVLKAADAVVRGTNARYESGGGKDNIGFWTNPDDYIVWRFKVTQTGTFDASVTFACAAGSGGSEYTLSAAKQKLAGKVKDTGSWTNFVTEKVGVVKIEKPGTYNLSVKPETMPAGAVMNLKSVTLVPVDK